ncbi:nucleoside-diphosphate-sugar epimerase family protein [Colletotrichum truncatum]|uniref:Nucleoside-diphosphate-sugar epimerase family protein n=1 Tax=Colletotrichum truncatum TaxID=5467 RepID=A0ACC3YXS1_COLTU|nr:nucleoside-diphosphate-sugar epimerase family protein [Colletotrichum truncatum]KAF6790926.1 nucleoside-diphosphate-sugar epimerase family protein [Colletotrichum truncatum]
MSADTQMQKAILVTGATGKQGGAVITSLLEAGAAKTHNILAVARNPGSASAKALESRGVKIVQGDLNDVPAIFAAAKTLLGGPEAEIWGVYSVQTAIGQGASAASEERQGKALVDEALANNVKHFVYSSIDRGGDSSYDNYIPRVQHFIGKYRIEHHLVDKAKDKMSWTILRPVAFMDNLTPGMGTKVTATSWRVAVQDKPLQLVAVRDVGWFAAQAFLRPQDFSGRQVPIAGDELTLQEANAIFKTKVGSEIPETFQFFVKFLHWMIADFGAMYRWFYTDGFRVDIPLVRREHSGLLTFEDWLEKESQFKTKSA